MISRADAAGTATFTYTGRGELDTATDPLTGKTTNHDWNDAGQVASVDYNTSPAATRTYGYDGQGRVTTDSLAAGGTALNSAAYGYDLDGNLTSQTITAAGNPAAGTNTYSYDRSGRLHSWTDPSSTVTTYGYDGAGNRTSAGSTTSAYDARNRLTSSADGSTSTTYGWSARGTLDSITNGTTTAVTFDALGRQTARGSTNYGHDSLDRITTAGSSGFAYAGTELDPVAVGTERYARTPAGELLAIDNNGTTRLVGENRHGDVAWLLDANGTVTDTRIWDPYGKVAGSTGSTNPSVGYQADYTDAASGEVWMGARWYQPSTGTFTSRDTVFGELKTPVSLNRYTYANADPLQYFDPDGRAHRWLSNTVSGLGHAIGSGVNAVQQTVSAAVNSVSSAASQVGSAVTATAKAAVAVSATVSRTVAVAGKKIGAGARQVSVAVANGAGKLAVKTASAVAAPVKACWRSDTCRSVAVGTATIAAAVTCSACAVGAALGGTISGGIGVATCHGNLGCVGRHMLTGAAGGAAAGLIGGQGLLATLGQGAFLGGGSEAASQFIGGKLNPGRIGVAAGAGALTAGALHGVAILARPALKSAGQRLASYLTKGETASLRAAARTRLADQTGSFQFPGGGAPRSVTSTADDLVPDDFVVVRGGTSDVPPPGEIFSGAAGRNLEDAAAGVPHGQIRETTAGQIRAGGGTVQHAPELTRSGVLNEKHVNICLGRGPCPFGPLQPNPVPKSGRIQ